MKKGISLHIGVNIVDKSHYGDENRLGGCVNDANAMKGIADAMSYASNTLLNEEATTTNLIKQIREASDELSDGDIFLLTFSGHGGQIWDQSGDENPDEAISYQGNQAGKKIYWDMGGKDETLCLYDRQYWDDELNRQLARFKSGVRILYIADCCHAMSNYKDINSSADAPQYRTLGMDKSLQVIKLNETYYADEWKGTRDFLKSYTGKIPASLIQLASCQDTQLSSDGEYGLFTWHLLQAWNNGGFSGNYQQLMNRINMQMPEHQTPVLSRAGWPNDGFWRENPFAI